MVVSAEQIALILGGPRVFGRRVTSMRELEDIVREGMPKSALDALIELLGAEQHGEFAVQLRNQIVPRSTYKRRDYFELQESETTERMARLYALALSVFEEPGAAVRFLASPHPELGDRRPFEVALTEIGGRAVEEVIARGLHGLPA